MDGSDDCPGLHTRSRLCRYGDSHRRWSASPRRGGCSRGRHDRVRQPAVHGLSQWQWRRGRVTVMNEDGSQPVTVVVTDIRLPFWSLVWLMVKVAIAALPAAIFLTMIILAVIATFMAI